MLHTVNKSPAEKNSLISCLRLAPAGSDILLIENGVYAAMMDADSSESVFEALGKHRLFVLEPDLACRGLAMDKVIPGIELVDYNGFVELAVANDSVFSWL